MGSSLSATEAQKFQKRQFYILAAIDKFQLVNYLCYKQKLHIFKR